MEFKDYYQILGVPADADEKTIKNTYRKLARQYHPDVNPNNKEAEEKFKEINEAYQVLSNKAERQKYDSLREQYLHYQQTGGRPGGFNWQQWAAQPGQGQQGVHVEYANPEDLEDLFGGESPFSDFFTNIFGGMRGAQGGTGARGRRGAGGQAAARKGRDLEYEVEVTLEEAYRGGTRLLQIGDHKIEARIPPGVRTGSRIRLAGQGEPGRNGGLAGDLYLITHVLPNPEFEREGDDLYTDVSVDIYTAILGGEVRVPTLDRPVMLRIPAHTQSGRSFRIRGKGMPHLGHPQEHGDLYARVRLVLPEHMSEHEVDVIRNLAEERARA